MTFHSIRFKLSILYTCALALLFTTYSLYLYASLRNALISDLDDELKIKSDQVQNFLTLFYQDYIKYTNNNDTATREAINMTIHLDEYRRGSLPDQGIDSQWLHYFDRLDLSEDRIHFFNISNNSSTATHNIGPDVLPLLLAEIGKHDPSETHYYGLRINNEVYRAVQKPLSFNGRDSYVLQIATSQKSALVLLEERKDILLYSLPVILLLAVMIGRVFAKQLTKPLIGIATAAEHISYKDLNQRVTARYKDEEIAVLVRAFNNMLDRLQKSFKHIAEFNSHVSHELKTPIAIISGECEVALRRSHTVEEYRESLQAIHAESQKMLRITEDLLMLSKLEYIHNILKIEVFSLTEFFEKLFQSFRKISSAREHDLRLKLPEKDAALRADPVHLRRLFLNIIGNAIKFTPAGGSITVDVAVRGRELIVRITDTGIGISDKDIHRIFDQFYQKTPASLQHLQGIGMGLSIARAIIKAHRGQISVTSTPNKGTTFLISLPVVTNAKVSGSISQRTVPVP